jgi:hypothetical protein
VERVNDIGTQRRLCIGHYGSVSNDTPTVGNVNPKDRADGMSSLKHRFHGIVKSYLTVISTIDRPVVKGRADGIIPT